MSSAKIATPGAWTDGGAFAIVSRQPAAAIEEAPWMDKALAIRLMEALQAAEPNLDILSALSNKVSDESGRRKLRRQIGEVLSAHCYMTMSIVCQYRDLDPDQESPDVRQPVSGEAVDRGDLEIGGVLRAAGADLEAVAALANDIGDQDEREEFRAHIADASALYREIMDAVVQGLLPELGRGHLKA